MQIPKLGINFVFTFLWDDKNPVAIFKRDSNWFTIVKYALIAISVADADMIAIRKKRRSHRSPYGFRVTPADGESDRVIAIS